MNAGYAIASAIKANIMKIFQRASVLAIQKAIQNISVRNEVIFYGNS